MTGQIPRKNKAKEARTKASRVNIHAHYEYTLVVVGVSFLWTAPVVQEDDSPVHATYVAVQR